MTRKKTIRKPGKPSNDNPGGPSGENSGNNPVATPVNHSGGKTEDNNRGKIAYSPHGSSTDKACNKNQLQPEEPELSEHRWPWFNPDFEVLTAEPLTYEDVKALLSAFSGINPPSELDEARWQPVPFTLNVLMLIEKVKIDTRLKGAEKSSYIVRWKHAGEGLVLNTLARMYGGLDRSIPVKIGDREPRSLLALLSAWSYVVEREPAVDPAWLQSMRTIRARANTLFPKKHNPELE